MHWLLPLDRGRTCPQTSDGADFDPGAVRYLREKTDDSSHID